MTIVESVFLAEHSDLHESQVAIVARATDGEMPSVTTDTYAAWVSDWTVVPSGRALVR